MRRLVAITVLFFIGASAAADTCFTSYDEWQVHSANGKWRLVGNPKPSDLRGPRVTLHRKDKTTWRRKARWTLPNSPAGVLLTNDGTTVTLDTGCHTGYGDHVVVIYRPDGTLTRNLALKDFLLDEDIESFSRSVSSIDWAGTHRIDEEKRQLILQVKGRPRMVELPISLDDGTLLVPKKRRFVRSFLSASVSYGAAPEEIAEVEECEQGAAVGSAELLSLVAEPVFPAYPEVALKARIEGKVVLEVAVNERGTVDSAVVIKPLPFGLGAAAFEAALQWRFRPAYRDRRPVAMCGRFSMNFALVPVDPTAPSDSGPRGLP